MKGEGQVGVWLYTCTECRVTGMGMCCFCCGEQQFHKVTALLPCVPRCRLLHYSGCCNRSCHQPGPDWLQQLGAVEVSNSSVRHGRAAERR